MVVAPTVVEVKTVKIIIKSLTGFSDKQAERFKKIVSKCEGVINSKEFARGVLQFSFEGKQHFVDTTDTNEKVLEKILSKDWTLDYRLEYIKKKPFSKTWTVGYTYPDVNWIVINSALYDTMGDEEVCDNVVHEYGGHKFGRYDHALKWSESRDYSVPYGLGYLAEKIYRGDK